jgi:hypothetical protein
MTVLECIQMGLSRTGLSTSNTDFQTQARIYLNAILQQLAGEATWWWLHKTDSIQCTREFTLASDTGHLYGQQHSDRADQCRYRYGSLLECFYEGAGSSKTNQAPSRPVRGCSNRGLSTGR